MLRSYSGAISRIQGDRYRFEPHSTRLVSHFPSQILGYPANIQFAISTPPNCEFQVDDAENEWTFHEPFNYIHARALVTCFKDNRAICQKVFDNLAPGGYFELQDPCFPVGCDDDTMKGTSLGE